MIKMNSFIFLFLILFLSLGYSAFNNNLVINDVKGLVRTRSDIRITGVVSSSSNGGYTNYDEYDVSSIESDIVLPNTNDTVSYRVEITNFGSQEMALAEITGLPSGLEIKNLSYLTSNVYGVKLCDGNRCSNGSKSYVDVIIGNIGSGSNSIISMHLDFVFKEVYSITYTGFSSVSGLGTEIVKDSSKNITFSSSNPVPSAVIVSGATGTYTSPTLTLSNPSANVTVTRGYTISYVDFTGSTSGLDSLITASGGTITFDATSGIPSNVTVTGATGTYTSPNLVLSNITGDITITAISAGNVTVHDNGDGTTTTETEIVTENPDGSTTTMINAVTTDSQGNTISTSETSSTATVVSGGTIVNSTTTNYDSQGNPTSGSNSNTDVNGNINTQELTYNSDGSSYVSGYTIDTTDNKNGTGETINNAAIDTGMVVFDGKGFELTMTAKFILNNNTGNTMLAAMQHNGNKYAGFCFNVYKTQDIYLYASTNGNLNQNTGVFGSQVNGSRPFKVTSANCSKVTEYTLYFKYLPANYGGNTSSSGFVEVHLEPTTKGSNYAANPYTKASTLLPASLSDATFTLGGNGMTTNQNMVNFEVISFELHKI